MPSTLHRLNVISVGCELLEEPCFAMLKWVFFKEQIVRPEC